MAFLLLLMSRMACEAESAREAEPVDLCYDTDFISRLYSCHKLARYTNKDWFVVVLDLVQYEHLRYKTLPV